MDTLLYVVQYILNLGAVSLLPILMTIFGMFFGMKLGRALKSGLLVGIGFQGLLLVTGHISTLLKPIVGYFEASGTGFSIVDMGWTSLAAAAWTAPFAAIVIPVGFALNLVLIYLGVTNTLNIDLWNYWHFLFAGAVVYLLFDNILLGILWALVQSVIVLLLGDLMAKKWQDYHGLPGTTCSTLLGGTLYLPLAVFFNKVIDLIPGLNKLDITPGKIREKYGMIGDPAFLGLFAGAFISILARQPVNVVIQTAVGISAVLILMPRMVSLLMEGLSPVARAATEYMSKKVAGRTIHMGMDYALGLGNDAVLTGGVIAIPIAVALALLMPGNQYFPLAMLGGLSYAYTIFCVYTNGNLFRATVGVTAYLAFSIIAFNYMAPVCTQILNAAGISTPGALTAASCLQAPSHFLITIIAKMMGKW